MLNTTAVVRFKKRAGLRGPLNIDIVWPSGGRWHGGRRPGEFVEMATESNKFLITITPTYIFHIGEIQFARWNSSSLATIGHALIIRGSDRYGNDHQAAISNQTINSYANTFTSCCTAMPKQVQSNLYF